MAGTKLSQVLINIKGKEATNLFFNPIFMDRDLEPLFTFIPNVPSKRDMYFVKKLENIVRKAGGCGFEVTGNTEIFKRPFQTYRQRVGVTMCYDELVDTALQELLNKGVDMDNIEGTLLAEVLMERVMEGIMLDNQKLRWFGDVDSTNPNYDSTDGFWKWIELAVAEGETPRYDSGTGALTPGAGQLILQEVYDQQSDVLYGLPDSEKKFMVSKSVYQQYKQDLKTFGGGDAGLNFNINGQQVVAFEGIEVIEQRRWTNILADLGDDKVNRAILTTPQNLLVGSDQANAGSAAPSLMTWFDMTLEKYYVKALYTYGTQILHPELISAAY